MASNLRCRSMRKNVLVIEDEPIIAEMISILLEIEGFKVTSLADTTRARQKLLAKEIDLVMLDLNLSGESGATMCAYIKSHDDLKNIPVILVSAHTDLQKIKEECGADDFIAKPFELEVFTSKVRNAVSAN